MKVKIKFGKLSLAALLLAAGSAFADGKVVVLDYELAMQKSPQGEVVSAKLKKENEEKEKALIKLGGEIKKKEDRQKEEGKLMSEDQKRDLEQQIHRLKVQHKREVGHFQEDFTYRRSEELAKLLNVVRKATETVAKREKYEVVVPTRSAFYVADSVDITNKVIAEMTAMAKK